MDLETGTKAAPTKNGLGTAKKTAKKSAHGPSRNPILLPGPDPDQAQVLVAELRKVIGRTASRWRDTPVVLLFLAFMVTLIGLVDLGLAKLVMTVFG